MAPAAGHAKSKAFTHPIATQSDDAKYKSKYKELKVKIGQVEEDNEKLQIKILKSKKAIQRLRIERSILYDRLQSSATPSNPFELHAKPHLAELASKPPSIVDPPSYNLADPEGPALYLKELDARKLAALKANEEFGSRPEVGVRGEEPDSETARNGAIHSSPETRGLEPPPVEHNTSGEISAQAGDEPIAGNGHHAQNTDPVQAPEASGEKEETETVASMQVDDEPSQ